MHSGQKQVPLCTAIINRSSSERGACVQWCQEMTSVHGQDYVALLRFPFPSHGVLLIASPLSRHVYRLSSEECFVMLSEETVFRIDWLSYRGGLTTLRFVINWLPVVLRLPGVFNR